MILQLGHLLRGLLGSFRSFKRHNRSEKSQIRPRGPEALEQRVVMSAYLPVGAAPSGCACPGCTGQGYVFAGQDSSGNAFQTPGYKWPQSSPGAPVTITYSYSNLLDGQLGGGLKANTIKAAIQEALGRWAAVAPLRFVEVADSGPIPSGQDYTAAGRPMLRFGHISIDGAYNVLAYGYYPGSSGLAGDVQFDRGENWKVNPSGGIDLLEVATHEVGHALGLAHEPMPSSGGQQAIMNPYYAGRFNGLGTSYLFADDINGIRALYGAGGGSVTPLGGNTSGPQGPAPAGAAGYITAVYEACLGRKPDQGDLNAWVAVYSSAGAGAVVQGIARSAEARTLQVKGYFTKFLGRTPSSEDVQPHVRALLAGESNEAIIVGILGSGEFYRRAQSLATGASADERYVRALYQVLFNRTTDQGDVNAWLSVLRSQGTLAVANGFVRSVECRAVEAARCYTELLGRSGSPADAWAWGSNGMNLQDIREAFLRSSEFIARSSD